MKKILPLSIAVAAVFCFAGEGLAGEIKASIVKSRELVEGRKTPVVIHLDRKGGLPILAEELEVVHTKPMHLLIIDPALTDYHHLHPRAMNTAGEYVFTMTPRTSCGYRVWADVDTLSGGQEFARADIPGADNCKGKSIDRTAKMIHEGENYRFILEPETDLKAGQETTLKMTVRDLKGRYIKELEPLMGAYAHMVGFYDDYVTVAHAHPMGEEPESDEDRGGPTLKFHFKPDREGFIKLFAQVKINGIVVAAPFGVEVKSESVSLNMDGMMGNDPFADTAQPEPIPVDAIPIGEPSKSEPDEIDKIMQEESNELSAESARKEANSLGNRYQGAGSDTMGQPYDPERGMMGAPRLQNLPDSAIESSSDNHGMQ